MTAPAQDWVRVKSNAVAIMCGYADDQRLVERIAVALSDAARTGREEGLEEAERGLLEMADHLQSDAPLSAGAIRNSAELLSALRGKEPKEGGPSEK